MLTAFLADMPERGKEKTILTKWLKENVERTRRRLAEREEAMR